MVLSSFDLRIFVFRDANILVNSVSVKAKKLIRKIFFMAILF